jgi:hypothetical protein
MNTREGAVGGDGVRLQRRQNNFNSIFVVPAWWEEEYRLKAEFPLVRVIDTLGHRKRVESVIEVLVAVAFFRSLRVLPLFVPIQTGLSRVSRHSRWALA